MKHSVIDTIRRYMRIYITYLRFTWISMTTYRASFFIELIIELGYILWLIIFYQVIFNNINEIAGWSRYEVLFLVGLSIIFTELVTGLFFVWNTRIIPERVRSGDMDYFLLKPIDSQFSLTTLQIYPSSFLSALIGFYLLFVSLGNLDTHPSIINIVAGTIIFIAGLMIGYAILTILSSFAIVFINANFLTQLPYQIFKFGEKPQSIYRGLLKGIFFFLIPIVFVASVPAEVFIRGGSLLYVPASLTIAAIALVTTRKVWTNVINHYSSASS